MGANVSFFLKRDNYPTFFLLLIFVILCWSYIIHLSKIMNVNNLDSMKMTEPNWDFYIFLSAFSMWSIMMVAMMLPSAMPMILLFSTISKKRKTEHKSYSSTLIFISGYIIVWVMFSLIASLIQMVLHYNFLISDSLNLVNPYASGLVLISAGIYQFTKLKNICLAKCQSPLNFLLSGWKKGKSGAFMMGLKHGLFCLGCCWILMLLLFVAGVMNLLWIALISFFVLIEKSIKNKYVSKVSGFLLLIMGIWVILGDYLPSL